MGLDLELVRSDARHYGAFICAICRNLVDLDSLVTTACSHCFCKQCLPVWLDAKNKTTCPTCNRDLLYSNNENQDNGQCMMMGSRLVLVRPLECGQPLAHRLLKSIAVRCPLNKGVRCHWEGDYGDLQSHLLSSTAHGDDATSARNSSQTAPALSTSNVSDKGDIAMNESSLSLLQAQQKNHVSLAASLKEEANGQFETKHYREANALYTKAISVLSPYYDNVNGNAKKQEEVSANVLLLLVTLYSNRAATYLQMQEYHHCLDDCNHALRRLGATNVKVYVRASRACAQLGQLERALALVKEAVSHDGDSAMLRQEAGKLEYMLHLEELGTRQLKNLQFAYAKTTYATLLKDSPAAISFLLGAARADVGLGLTDSALRLTKRVLVRHAQNPQGCTVRGQVLFLMGEFAAGMQLLQEALRLDPDSKEIKQSYCCLKRVKECIEQSRQAMFARQFTQAVELVTSGIQHYQPPLPPQSPLYAILYTHRAQAYLRLKKFTETLQDCALVLYAQENHIPACLLRYQAYHGLEDHDTAVTEIKEMLSKFPQDARLQTAYERADFIVRKERRVNYYQLLGCASVASELEIKKAYKQKALEWHPDKLPPGSSPAQRQRAQHQFQLLGQGLEILCDDVTRKLYDEGYDPEAIRHRVAAAEQAAHRRGGGYHHQSR